MVGSNTKPKMDAGKALQPMLSWGCWMEKRCQYPVAGEWPEDDDECQDGSCALQVLQLSGTARPVACLPTTWQCAYLARRCCCHA